MLMNLLRTSGLPSAQVSLEHCNRNSPLSMLMSAMSIPVSTLSPSRYSLTSLMFSRYVSRATSRLRPRVDSKRVSDVRRLFELVHSSDAHNFFLSDRITNSLDAFVNCRVSPPPASPASPAPPLPLFWPKGAFEDHKSLLTLSSTVCLIASKRGSPMISRLCARRELRMFSSEVRSEASERRNVRRVSRWFSF